MSDKKTRPTPDALPEIDPEDVFVVDDIPSPGQVSALDHGVDSFAASPDDSPSETELPFVDVAMEAETIPEKDKRPTRPIISRDKGPGGPQAKEKSAAPESALPGFTPPVASSEALEADIEWPGGVPSLETIPTVVKPAKQDEATSFETSPQSSDPALTPNEPLEHPPEYPTDEPVSFAAEEIDPSPRNRAIDFDLDDLALPGMDIGPLSNIDFDAPAPNSDTEKNQGEAAPSDSSSPASLGVRIEAPSPLEKPVEESPDYQPFEDIEHDLGSPENSRALRKDTTEDEAIEREAAELLDAIRLPENGHTHTPPPDSSEELSSQMPSWEEPGTTPSPPEKIGGDTFTTEDIREPKALPEKKPVTSPEESPEDSSTELSEEPEAAVSPSPALKTDEMSDHGEEEDQPPSFEEEEEAEEEGEEGEELSGWPIESSRSFPDFVFDRGEETLLSVSGNEMEELKDLTDRKGFLRYIVDYPEAMVLDVRDFPGEPKYAQVLTRKRLEEQGELTSDGQLVIYSAKKSGPNTFKALYQVVPNQPHAAVLKRYNTYNSGFVIFDTVALLRGLLLKLDKKKTHALAMHCPEAILLLVGKGEDILLARRYALMGDDQAQLDEGLTTLQRDIETAENLEGEVENLVWIEPLLEQADIPPPETQIPLTPWPLTRLQKGDEAVFSALPGIVKRLPVTSSLGPKEETWLRPLETAEKWLWALLLVGILACAGSWYVFTSLKDSARLETTDIQHRIKELERRLPQPQNFQSELIKPSVELAQKINQAVLAPPPAVLWNELAEATPSSLHIYKVIMAYGKDKVEASLAGEIRLGLVEAQAVFIEFLSRLEQADFKVDTQKLLLDIQGNSFSVKLTKAYE